MVKHIFFIGLISLFLSSAVQGEQLKIVAHDAKPYSFLNRGKVDGFFVDVVEEMFKRAALPFKREDIEIDTFSSVLAKAATTPNTIFLTVVRSAGREKLFHWIGPVANFSIAILAKKDNPITIDSLEDVKKYNIASMKNIMAESIFEKQGGNIKKLTRVTRPKQLYRLVEYNRVDGVLFNDVPFFYLAAQAGHAGNYKYVKVLGKKDLYIAINKETSPEIVQKLQSAYSQMTQPQKDGISVVQKMIEKYLK